MKQLLISFFLLLSSSVYAQFEDDAALLEHCKLNGLAAFCYAGQTNCTNPGADLASYLSAGAYSGACGSPSDSSAPPKPPLPFLAPAVLGALGLAAGLMAGLAAFAAAPAIVPALALATALAAGIAAMPFGSSKPPITPANLDTVPPIKITMAPSSVPAPQLGSPGGPGDGPAGSSNAPGAPPSVTTDPDGSFVPRGGTPYTDAASGGWQPAGEYGNFNYYPPATADNPNPQPILVITNGGANLTQALSQSVSGYPSEMLSVTRTAEGQTAVTQSANVPVSGPDGNPALAQTHKTTVYQGLTGTSATPVGDPVVRVNPSLSDGTPVTPSTTMTVLAPVTGTGTGTGTGDGTGGGCTGGDCATESTQLANKAHLKSIDDFLKGEGTPSTVPEAKKTADFQQAGLTRDSPAFAAVLGFRLPAHNSTCPQPSFAWNGTTYAFSAHCQLVTDHFAAFRAVFTVIFTVSALFIVLKA